MNIIIPEKQVFIDFSSVVASLSSIILHTRPSLSMIILPYPVGFSASNAAIRISFDFRESDKQVISDCVISGVSPRKTKRFEISLKEVFFTATLSASAVPSCSLCVT